jgi:hypothetical protein
VQSLIESASAYLEKAKQLAEHCTGAVEESAMACEKIEKNLMEIKKVYSRMLEIIG